MVGCTCVMADDYLQPELEEINRQALKTGTPWFLCKPNGLIVWLGPVFSPGRTGCWECLAQRLRSHREVEGFVQQVKSRERPYVARPALASTLQTAAELATTEVAKWIAADGVSLLEGKVLSFDTVRLRAEEHALVRRPQCSACGDPESLASAAAPIVLRDLPKGYVEDGGHRTVPPETTWKAYRHHVSPITGAVKTLVRATSEDDQLQHVYSAGQNMARQYPAYEVLRRGLRSASCGKGQTDMQARVSALCEAIERHSGVFQGNETRIQSSMRALGERAIDPRTCMLFSEAQYRDRERLNARERRFNWIPLPFDEELDIEWSSVWSLTRHELRYVPTSYCYYHYPAPLEHAVCSADSNGSAAGNTVEEAILQGFFELIERDSVALWWYTRVRRPQVDLASFEEPYVDALVVHHERIGRELWVLDVTSDLGIPSFVALSRRVDKPIEDIVFAASAHFDPRIGLLRALAELNQMMPAVAGIGADGSGEYTFGEKEAVEWWKTATLEGQPYLAPDRHTRPTKRSDYPRQWTDNLRDDVLACQSIVETRGYEVLVLDQTRPDIGLPVVKVIVPGLRHFWSRYAPGRLYDVPVALGWTNRPSAEENFNPIEVFI